MALRSAQSSPVRVDTHAHVFARGLAMVPGRRYTPDGDALLADYLALLDQSGLSHGVLVQPSFLGCDNQFLIASLLAAPHRLRGVAVVEPGEGDDDLAGMDRAGVVGIRLNLFGRDLPALSSPNWQRLLLEVNKLGWHVEVHTRASTLPAVLGPLLAQGCRVVVDHFGRPDPTLGVNDPGFIYLQTQAATGCVWVKLSAAYRNATPADRGGARAAGLAMDAAEALLSAFGPERLLWGSDWPHTEHRQLATFASCFDALQTWVPDPGQRSAILGDTPAELFKI